MKEGDNDKLEVDAKRELKKMGYDIDTVAFKTMHRLGMKREDGAKPRSIVAVPKDSSDIKKLTSVKITSAQKRTQPFTHAGPHSGSKPPRNARYVAVKRFCLVGTPCQNRS